VHLFQVLLVAVFAVLARRLDAQHPAEVFEMRLRATLFGEGVVLPGGDELFGGHGQYQRNTAGVERSRAIATTSFDPGSESGSQCQAHYQRASMEWGSLPMVEALGGIEQSLHFCVAFRS
jgi:hypothetical protein